MEKVRNAINVVIFFVLIAFIANSLLRLVLFYLHSPQTP